GARRIEKRLDVECVVLLRLKDRLRPRGSLWRHVSGARYSLTDNAPERRHHRCASNQTGVVRAQPYLRRRRNNLHPGRIRIVPASAHQLSRGGAIVEPFEICRRVVSLTPPLADTGGRRRAVAPAWRPNSEATGGRHQPPCARHPP